MSLLSPKLLQISLFLGEIRFHSTHLQDAISFDVEMTNPVEQTLQMLDEQLALHHSQVIKHQRVALLVSDHFGIVQSLPWQDNLLKRFEIEQYGRLCVESTIGKEQGWTLHTELPSFGNPGIVYGFSDPIISQITALCEKHSLKLFRLLPLSAQIFFRVRDVLGRHQQLVFTVEAKRITAISVVQGRLQGFDVEPVIGSLHDATLRILRRCQQIVDGVNQYALWCSNPHQYRMMQDFFETQLPDAQCTSLSQDVWRLS